MSSILEVARLIQSCEKIGGRVILQKIVHILQEAGFDSFTEEFGYLHHGPYSSDLKREIDQLIDWKLIDEKAEQVIQYPCYIYTPSRKLEDVLADIGVGNEADWNQLAQELNEKQPANLEAISTIMFLRRRGFSGTKLENRFNELKSHLSSRFKESLSFAEEHQKLKSPAG